MTSAHTATRPPLVLIADAQEWFSRALETVLVPGGYSVVKAYTAAALLKQIEATPPDAVILAVDLPGGDGLDVCRLLRTEERVTPSTPIILTQPTPTTQRQTLAALRAGAVELWGQHLDAEELLLRMAAQLRAKSDADRARGEGLVDPATNVYNARGLARRTRELGAQARRRGRGPLACITLVGGKEAGASAERVTGVLRQATRGADAIGRLGPWQFAVIAPETGAEGAARLAERLVGALAQRPQPRKGGRLEFVAAYEVVADASLPTFDPAALLARASAALAAAVRERSGPTVRPIRSRSQRK